MLETLAGTSEPVTLIATGPWSNIAVVVRRTNGQQRRHIGGIALMGGEVHLLHAGANVACDPKAAHEILQSGLPIFLETWSLSRRLFFTMAEVKARQANATDPFLRDLHHGDDVRAFLDTGSGTIRHGTVSGLCGRNR